MKAINTKNNNVYIRYSIASIILIYLFYNNNIYFIKKFIYLHFFTILYNSLHFYFYIFNIAVPTFDIFVACVARVA